MRSFRIAAAATMLGLVVTCGGGSTSDTALGPSLDANKIAAACFQGGTTPEVQIGSGFTGADWNDPHVLTGLANSLQVVGVMTFDGITWSTPELAFKPDQTVYPRASNWVGYSTPNAVVIAGKVHVFVDVANDGSGNWTQVALHHASSADGLTGWTQDAAPIRRLTDFTWTAREIRSPAAFLDGTTLRLYFAGDDIGNTNAWGIGQMTCSLAP